VPTVTALRPDGRARERVSVELDGAPWRVVPLEVAYRAGLAVGLELDRPTLRVLRRELRRAEALGAALRTLRHRDHSTASLAGRLERRGIAPAERKQVLGSLTRAGVVDDARFAEGRASSLAGRGVGDLLIADDLDQHGLASELVDAALAGLEPELERAARVVAKRGHGPKTWRYLAGKGFTPETLEALVADDDVSAVG
jgi:SOS response regulatory protein OraA/RecX